MFLELTFMIVLRKIQNTRNKSALTTPRFNFHFGENVCRPQLKFSKRKISTSSCG